MILFRFFTERPLGSFRASVLSLGSFLSRLKALVDRPLSVWVEPYLGGGKQELIGGAAIPGVLEGYNDSFAFGSRAARDRSAFDFLFRFESENPGSIYYKNTTAKRSNSTNFGSGHGNRLDLALSEVDAAGLSEGEVVELLRILREIFEASGAVYGYGTRCDPLAVQSGRSAEEISTGAMAEIFDSVWHKIFDQRGSGVFCLNYLGPALSERVETGALLTGDSSRLASGGTILWEGWRCLLEGEPSPTLRTSLAAIRPQRYEKGLALLPTSLSLLLAQSEVEEIGGADFVGEWFPADRIERVAGRWWHLTKENRTKVDALLEREILWPLRPGRLVEWRVDLPKLRLGFVDRYFAWNQPDALRAWFDLSDVAEEIELQVDLYRRPSARTRGKLDELLEALGFVPLEASEKRFRFRKTSLGETSGWLDLLSSLEDFGYGTAPLIVTAAASNNEQARRWAAMTRESRLYTQV